MKLVSQLLFYHPTSWLFLGDQQSSSASSDSIVPSGQKYRTFVHPEVALDAIAVSNDGYYEKSRRLIEDSVGIPLGDALEMSSTFAQQSVLGRTQSTSVISVVISDYSLPQVSGLEFLAEIDDAAITKILVVDSADESLAADALNEGLIDHFLMKNDKDAKVKLSRFGRRSRVSFFEAVQRGGLGLFSGISGPLASSEVWGLLWSRLDRGEYTEFCCVGEPGGFLVTRPDGSRLRLLFFGERDYEEANRFATRFGAPDRILEQLSAKKILICTDGINAGQEQYELDWNEVLIPASVLGSSGIYRYGEYDDPVLELGS